jgi:CRP/FNR family transcriptional regulator
MTVAPAVSTWHLRQFSVFQHFDHDELAQVSRRIHTREFRAREPIFIPGEAAKSIHFLLSGRVKITRTDPSSGREHSLYVVRPGELFGILARQEDGHGNTGATAIQRSLVGHLRAEAFERLLRNESFAREVMRLTGERLLRVATHVDDLVFRDVHARLLRLLLQLSEQFPGETRLGLMIDVKLTQEDMAGLIGTSRESVNIALHDFRRQGLIDVQGHRIIVRDVHRLAKAAR